MRKFIIDRIEEIRKLENNFSQHSMRWQHVTMYDTHISVLNLDVVSDEDLTKLFEKIIRRYYIQM